MIKNLIKAPFHLARRIVIATLNTFKGLFKPRKRGRLDISTLDAINERGWAFTCELEPNNYLITIKNKITTKKSKKESE